MMVVTVDIKDKFEFMINYEKMKKNKNLLKSKDYD